MLNTFPLPLCIFVDWLAVVSNNLNRGLCCSGARNEAPESKVACCLGHLPPARHDEARCATSPLPARQECVPLSAGSERPRGTKRTPTRTALSIHSMSSVSARHQAAPHGRSMAARPQTATQCAIRAAISANAPSMADRLRIKWVEARSPLVRSSPSRDWSFHVKRPRNPRRKFHRHSIDSSCPQGCRQAVHMWIRPIELAHPQNRTLSLTPARH